MNRSNVGLLLSAATSLYSMPLAAVELAGQVNIEHRQFFDSGSQGQRKAQTSLVLQPEFYWEMQNVMRALPSHLSIVWIV